MIDIAKRKQPANVWIENNLIKIHPFKTDNVYYLDYSKEMYEIVKDKRWTVSTNPYPVAWIDGRNILLHHLILPSKYNEGWLVDHINRDTRDNRINNLRYVNRYESGINRNDMSDNKTGYKGVYFRKDRYKYLVYINVKGKRKYLGHFENKDDAIAARKTAEQKYYKGIIQAS